MRLVFLLPVLLIATSNNGASSNSLPIDKMILTMLGEIPFGKVAPIAGKYFKEILSVLPSIYRAVLPAQEKQQLMESTMNIINFAFNPRQNLQMAEVLYKDCKIVNINNYWPNCADSVSKLSQLKDAARAAISSLLKPAVLQVLSYASIAATIPLLYYQDNHINAVWEDIKDAENILINTKDRDTIEENLLTIRQEVQEIEKLVDSYPNIPLDSRGSYLDKMAAKRIKVYRLINRTIKIIRRVELVFGKKKQMLMDDLQTAKNYAFVNFGFLVLNGAFMYGLPQLAIPIKIIQGSVIAYQTYALCRSGHVIWVTESKMEELQKVLIHLRIVDDELITHLDYCLENAEWIKESVEELQKEMAEQVNQEKRRYEELQKRMTERVKQEKEQHEERQKLMEENEIKLAKLLAETEKQLEIERLEKHQRFIEQQTKMRGNDKPEQGNSFIGNNLFTGIFIGILSTIVLIFYYRYTSTVNRQREIIFLERRVIDPTPQPQPYEYEISTNAARGSLKQ